MVFKLRIAIDAMGGECGERVTVPAVALALQKYPQVEFWLAGDAERIESQLLISPITMDRGRLKIIHTPFLLTDKDKPTWALRSKQKSSLYVTVELLRDHQVSACVSAGNTGALLLTGRHLLGTLPGIEKPAIVATIPGASKNSLLLDVGANVDCKAEQLFQFAVMGSVLAESMGLSGRARVALLNIGVEDYKGNDQVRAASELLENCKAINYIGFVEGSDLYSGSADVVVCDGFVGNVTIKSSAGVVTVISSILANALAGERTHNSQLLEPDPILEKMLSLIDPARFNGASLLGLNGSVIKSHGNATVGGFLNAISRAVDEAEKQVPLLIADRVAGIINAIRQREAAV